MDRIFSFCYLAQFDMNNYLRKCLVNWYDVNWVAKMIIYFCKTHFKILNSKDEYSEYSIVRLARVTNSWSFYRAQNDCARPFKRERSLQKTVFTNTTFNFNPGHLDALLLRIEWLLYSQRSYLNIRIDTQLKCHKF